MTTVQAIYVSQKCNQLFIQYLFFYDDITQLISCIGLHWSTVHSSDLHSVYSSLTTSSHTWPPLSHQQEINQSDSYTVWSSSTSVRLWCRSVIRTESILLWWHHWLCIHLICTVSVCLWWWIAITGFLPPIHCCNLLLRNGLILHGSSSVQVVPCMTTAFISVHDKFYWGVVPNMNAYWSDLHSVHLSSTTSSHNWLPLSHQQEINQSDSYTVCSSSTSVCLRNLSVICTVSVLLWWHHTADQLYWLALINGASMWFHSRTCRTRVELAPLRDQGYWGVSSPVILRLDSRCQVVKISQIL